MKGDYTHKFSESPGEVSRLEQQAKAMEFILEQELQVLKPISGMRVLDAGCGTGAVTRRLAKAVAPGEASGVDFNPPFLSAAKEFAREKMVANIRFEEASINSLPYPNGMFDMSYCRLVLMHMPDPFKTVSEMKRVTKTGGIVAASDVDDDAAIWYPETPALRSLFTRYAEFSKTRGSDRHIGRKLYEIFSRAGLSPVQIVPFTFTATSESPQVLRAFTGILSGILLQSKNDMIKEGFATERNYDQAMRDRDFLLNHPGSFGMVSTLLAIGKNPQTSSQMRSQKEKALETSTHRVTIIAHA